MGSKARAMKCPKCGSEIGEKWLQYDDGKLKIHLCPNCGSEMKEMAVAPKPSKYPQWHRCGKCGHEEKQEGAK